MIIHQNHNSTTSKSSSCRSIGNRRVMKQQQQQLLSNASTFLLPKKHHYYLYRKQQQDQSQLPQPMYLLLSSLVLLMLHNIPMLFIIIIIMIHNSLMIPIHATPNATTSVSSSSHHYNHLSNNYYDDVYISCPDDDSSILQNKDKSTSTVLCRIRSLSVSGGSQNDTSTDTIHSSPAVSTSSTGSNRYYVNTTRMLQSTTGNTSDIPTKSPMVEDRDVPSQVPVPAPPTVRSPSSPDGSAPIPTALPTYIEKCYVCGTSERYVGMPNDMAYFVGEEFRCIDLETAGRIGFIPPGTVCSLAQQAANFSCSCQNTTIAPGTIQTTTPTITPQPTTSISPTSSNQPCYLCGTRNSYIVNIDAIVTVFDRSTTCRFFDRYARDIGFPTDVCQYFTQIVYEICGCSTISAAPTPLLTLFPTISNIPTITDQPTYTVVPECYLCNNQSSLQFNTTTNGSGNGVVETLALRGYIYSCSFLQNAASDRTIDPKLCTEVQERNKIAVRKPVSGETGCTCIPVVDDNNAAPTTTTNNNSNNVPSTTGGGVPQPSPTQTSSGSTYRLVPNKAFLITSTTTEIIVQSATLTLLVATVIL